MSLISKPTVSINGFSRIGWASGASSWLYERGEYYETLSDALPIGSRAWLEQKEREGNRFPF